MKASKDAINLIKEFEGLNLKAYKCPSGVWTIGYGHTKGVKEGMEITKETAEKLLIIDINEFERQLNSLGLNLRQNQFDALISLIFNIGIGNFKKSVLYNRIKMNADDLKIKDIWENSFVKSGGKILMGLVRRRKKEAELYFKHLNEKT